MHSLNVDALLKSARERTGLSDFGPEDFMEALHVLVDNINATAEIRDDRWSILREQFFLRLLMNRLWFARDLAEHPEILEQDPGSPIIAASLPRTGSTKLHRMLGASGDFQVLRMWSGRMFARIPGLADGGVARRIEENREFEKWMYATSPGILAGHPLFTDEPDEDPLLGEATFRHPWIYGWFNVPGYAQWIMQADMRPTYDYLLQQLKYLQWQFQPQGAKPWLLKAPTHFGSEGNLTRIFENPRFIFTHRDPAKCVPSTASAALAYCKLHSDRDNSAAFGAGVTEALAGTSLAHMKWRDANPDLKILDLGFREINEDGMSAVRKVYDFFGMPLSAAAEEAMRNWEQNNRREKHPGSNYSAAAIGTTDDGIRRAFAPYMERYAEFL